MGRSPSWEELKSLISKWRKEAGHQMHRSKDDLYENALANCAWDLEALMVTSPSDGMPVIQEIR